MFTQINIKIKLAKSAENSIKSSVLKINTSRLKV